MGLIGRRSWGHSSRISFSEDYTGWILVSANPFDGILLCLAPSNHHMSTIHTWTPMLEAETDSFTFLQFHTHNLRRTEADNHPGCFTLNSKAPQSRLNVLWPPNYNICTKQRSDPTFSNLERLFSKIPPWDSVWTLQAESVARHSPGKTQPGQLTHLCQRCRHTSAVYY